MSIPNGPTAFEEPVAGLTCRQPFIYFMQYWYWKTDNYLQRSLHFYDTQSHRVSLSVVSLTLHTATVITPTTFCPLTAPVPHRICKFPSVLAITINVNVNLK
jgi:hypothetical protein